MKTNDLLLVVEARAATASGAATRIRAEARLSQGDLARAIGVHPATICRWEKGRRIPSGPGAVRYGRLLRALGDAA